MNRPNEYLLVPVRPRGNPPTVRRVNRYRVIRTDNRGVSMPIATIEIPVLPTGIADEIGSALNHELSQHLKTQRGE